MTNTIATTLCLLVVSGVLINASRTIEKRSLADDAERIVQEGRHISSNNVGQLIDLLKRHNAVNCLRRTICKLSNNPHLYDAAGTRFGENLLKLRHSKHPEIKIYLDAMTQGVRGKSSDCDLLYTNCPYSNKEIIDVGNKVLHS